MVTLMEATVLIQADQSALDSALPGIRSKVTSAMSDAADSGVEAFHSRVDAALKEFEWLDNIDTEVETKMGMAGAMVAASALTAVVTIALNAGEWAENVSGLWDTFEEESRKRGVEPTTGGFLVKMFMEPGGINPFAASGQKLGNALVGDASSELSQRLHRQAAAGEQFERDAANAAAVIAEKARREAMALETRGMGRQLTLGGRDDLNFARRQGVANPEEEAARNTLNRIRQMRAENQAAIASERAASADAVGFDKNQREATIAERMKREQALFVAEQDQVSKVADLEYRSQQRKVTEERRMEKESLQAAEKLAKEKEQQAKRVADATAREEKRTADAAARDAEKSKRLKESGLKQIDSAIAAAAGKDEFQSRRGSIDSLASSFQDSITKGEENQREVNRLAALRTEYLQATKDGIEKIPGLLEQIRDKSGGTLQ